MIMASFKTTFVAIFLLCFSYSFLIGCAQQYEYDYSAEARVSSWQSSRTSRTRSSDAPSRFEVKNSSPNVPVRSRSRPKSRYEGDGIAKPQYETARQYDEEQTERAQSRGRQRAQQRVREDTGKNIDRKLEEVTPPTPVSPRRRPSKFGMTESTTQQSEQFIPRLSVSMQNAPVKQPRGFVAPPHDGTGRTRQRMTDPSLPPETSNTASPRPFPRGRVKAKIYDTSRRSTSSLSLSSSSDYVSETDNYPPGFIEKIKKAENRQSEKEDSAAPRRSRLRQRAAKTYPAIALSEANRFRQRYTRPTTSTEKSQTTTEFTTNEETSTRKNTLSETRQRNRTRYTTPKTTTDFAPKPFRSYNRQFSITEKNENSTTGYATSISPRQKYLSRLRTASRQFKPPKVIQDKIVEDKKKEEALEPAENTFYRHPEDITTEESKQKMKNMDIDLKGDASEEDERVETEKTTARPTTTTTSATATFSMTTTTTTVTTSKPAATDSASINPSNPATRHRFSSRFSRSNKTTLSEDTQRPTSVSKSLVLDNVTPAPINLTSLFDDSPDSTLSITALFNNSFNASSSVATNKTNSPETLTNSTITTSTARPSTVTENSSSSSTTTKRASTKKKSQKKSRKSGKGSTTTMSPVDVLNDRPILRNIMSLFGNGETTTKRSSGKGNSSTGRPTGKTITSTTTTITTTVSPKVIEKIQTIINETMEVIHNRTGGPAPARLVPRLALNALTPETSVEETTTTVSNTTYTTTNKAPTRITSSIKAPTTTSSATIARTTTTTFNTTTSKNTDTTRSAAIPHDETPKRNCSTQYIYFDYNSSAPIPQQFANFHQKGRAETTPSTTTTSTTADYFVYGVYPNNTVVRKRAWKTFDYERYHSPYVIFGIYPNNTIVKKFPNGTVINDEFMTSDNEIRDLMGMPRRPITTSTTTTTTGKPETTTTTQQTTTASIKPSTTLKAEMTTAGEMRMAGSITTENRIEDVTTEEESPDSMFEIIENEIQKEELSLGTTESANPAVRDENVFEEHLLSTTEIETTTTDQPSRLAESIETSTSSPSTTEATTGASTIETSSGGAMETTTSVSKTEALESVLGAPTTVKSVREGKSFSFKDIFGVDSVDTTTEGSSRNTSGSTSRDTTESDLFAKFRDEIETEVPTSTESTMRVTDSTDRTTENYFDLQQIFQPTTMRDDRPFDIDIRLSDAPTRRPFTTEAGVEEGTAVQSLSDLEGDRLFSTTTEVSTISIRSATGLTESKQVEATTTEATPTSKSTLDLQEVDLFGPKTPRSHTESGASDNSLIESTTAEVPITTNSLFELSEANVFGPTEAPTTSRSLFDLLESKLSGSTTIETPTTTTPSLRSSSRTPAALTILEIPTTQSLLFGLSENNIFGSTTTDTPITVRPVYRSSDSSPGISATPEVPTTLSSLFDFSENSLFASTTIDSPTPARTVFRQSENIIESTTTESPASIRSLFGLSESDLFGTTTTEGDPNSKPSGVSTTAEVPTTLTSISDLSENSLFGSTTIKTPTTATPVFRSPSSTITDMSTTMSTLFDMSQANLFGSPTTEAPGKSESPIFITTGRKNSEETTTTPNSQNEIIPLDGDLFQFPEIQSSVTKSTMREDEKPSLVNLAYRALGSSYTITTAPTPTTLNYITSTMKSTNYKEKKVRMKMKRTSTSTPKAENVFIVTPETINDSEYGRKGKVKFVTLTPGVIVTTDVRDENDVITMSSQHVQKVTKAPANIPDNFLTNVVGEIQLKSSSPIPDILKNVEKELQGNGISVSLARRIIEMAIERAVTTEAPQTTGQIKETTFTTPYITTTTTIRAPTTTRRDITTTTANTTPTSRSVESTTANEISTAYFDLTSTVNVSPLSVGFTGDSAESSKKEVNEEEINRLVQGLWNKQTEKTTIRTMTTTKSSKRTKSSRNPASSGTTLSQNDKLILEAILKQQNSNLSVQELDKIIENQIRLAEEVRKASKNLKRPRVTTTTTTTTTQTPPLFGFLISLFSGNSSPSNIPVTRSPIKQTRSRLKASRGPGSMSNNPKKPDPFKETEVGTPSGERSTRGELVTAAIDVTKAVSRFMGTFLSSAAQSFQAFFSNFGRGR